MNVLSLGMGMGLGIPCPAEKVLRKECAGFDDAGVQGVRSILQCKDSGRRDGKY